jgi:protease-4
MGNVAASGGYYIAMDCDRIFALPNTITGSIGVYGVKLDFAQMAAQYGVTRHYISTGQHSATYDAFHPLTRPMRDNFTRNVDRTYQYFKSIVSEGRGLSMEAVEDLAEGRVWTGEQAKAIGLVDELGGQSRAIAYAQRNYTCGDAVVEVWPKPKSLSERLLKSSDFVSAEVEKASLLQAVWLALFKEDLKQTVPVDRGSLNLPSSGLVLAVDENLALKYCLREFMGTSASEVAPQFSANFWV